MSQLDRHCTICECIKTRIVDCLQGGMDAVLGDIQHDLVVDPYMAAEVRIEDFDRNQQPGYGIIVSPESEEEDLGTNERDDIVYTCLVTRVVSSLTNDDKSRRLAFRQILRLLFHNKRIICDTNCYIISHVQFGMVKVPAEWEKNNNSVSITRVKVRVRESRIKE